MKKLFTLLLLSVLLFTGCEKENEPNEVYTVVYTTILDQMTVQVSSTTAINPANLTQAFKPVASDARNLTYKVSMSDKIGVTIDFIKLDGSVYQMTLLKNNQFNHISF